MEQSIHVETGAQLLARLMKRPILHELEKVLFSEGPRPNECLLPRRYKGIKLNGQEAGVVLVNTDHHFHIPTLVDLMACFIRNNNNVRKLGADIFDDKVIKSIIEESLRYLTIINCYESSQFLVGLQSLQGILSNDDKIAIVAIDSISSYYWQDRKHGECWSMDGYVKSCLKTMQKHTFGHKIILLYTRPSDVESERKEAVVRASLPNEEKVHYKIQLHKQHDVNKFSAVVESAIDKRNLSYIVSNNGIEWRTCYSKG
ncbi:DNA repair protein XRCC2 isoform X2 [Diprion similis]|uniref:DNA repair protein XRCC2 isoform X2 n=1 Tax=Diprion similis TaxID=362088 RepID=UPI001EF9122A|nr:DNA repair protein XRCC2 isoform X2 [Diprion similis]